MKLALTDNEESKLVPQKFSTRRYLFNDADNLLLPRHRLGNLVFTYNNLVCKNICNLNTNVQMGEARGLSDRGHVLVHLFFSSVIFNGASVYLSASLKEPALTAQ